MKKFYTNEKNVQIIISLLKSHGIRKVIASPGATNVAFVGSLQHDDFFEIYSAVDERSAAYIACGLAAESGEPVVISCTGATASRNYLPGLTEAFYRKLPVLALTSTQAVSKVGHHVAQVIDRSTLPKDVATLSVTLPIVKDGDDFWECEVKVNQALLALKHRGGGPVHINVPTVYDRSFDIKELPPVRTIRRISYGDTFPELKGRVSVMVGAHKNWTQRETDALDRFCAANDAVVFCDHTSSYHGLYRVQFALAASQQFGDKGPYQSDVFIHLGEITGDYATIGMSGKQVWRVSEDGILRDTFRKLSHLFEMKEADFFEHYSARDAAPKDSFLKSCRERLAELRTKIPEVPFSNIWLASRMAHRIPEGSTMHFGILNSLRAWNYFELPASVMSASNTGGFGIDGCLSSLIGASLFNKDKLYYLVLGDLAFFYDMNALGNRHVGRNLRILVVNNGKGTEFKNYAHHAARFGDDAEDFMAASGHFGNRSPVLIKHYAEALGFEYIAASSKADFELVYERFLAPGVTDRPMVFEVFTHSDEESSALEAMMKIDVEKKTPKSVIKDMLGEEAVATIKKFLK
jgi:2-succinyl-5-enolpyruvyl-6-hydroxy-3-cyclohexene-1-carboxylate synthase